MVKCVRTTCLFSKLQEDVVSRKHHEQCSDGGSCCSQTLKTHGIVNAAGWIHANTLQFSLQVYREVYPES